jgi:hypothetical protein
MICIKEEFVGGEKYRRAMKLGRADAIVLWLALKCYASEHPSSEGFVADEDIDTLKGAPRGVRKALQALVDCGRLLPDGTRSSGLIDMAKGGWQLHDYLDHSATPEELELRREKARLKKQKQRQEQRRELGIVQSQTRNVSRVLHQGREQSPRALGAGGIRGDMSPGTPGDRRGDMSPGTPGDTGGQTGGHVPRDTRGDVPGTGLAGARPPAHALAPAPVRALARPSPALPTPLFSNKDPDPDARAGGRVPGDTGGHGARGYERVEPLAEHRRYAELHCLNLEECMRSFREDPRTARLSTTDAWAQITKLLEKEAAAERQGRVGGVA